MAKLKKRVHKDTKKIAGMVSKKASGREEKNKSVVKNVAKKHKVQVPKMAAQKKPDHFRPPAAEEWKALQEGSNINAHYNFFKLQADEYLTAIHRKQENIKPMVDKWLTAFNGFLDDLKSSEKKYDLTQPIPWLKNKNIQVPFEMSTTGIKGSFKFVAPKKHAHLIGSHTFSATIPCDNAISVDVAVSMPKEFFQTADYLNFTYHYKKGLYMAYVLLKAGKSKVVDVSQAQYLYLDDDPMQPVMVVPLSEANSKMRVKVHLHFYMESGTYKLSRFIPERNNIRAVTVSSTLAEDQETVLNTVPTYHYNNSMLRDLIVEENHRLMTTLIGKFAPVSDALILLKYWLRKRRLNNVLHSYALTMLMCHLVRTKKVNAAAMSYYQIVRIFFSHFQLSDVYQEITLRDVATPAENAPTLPEMRIYGDLCFMDSTGFYNIFSKLHASEMKRMVVESGKSLQMMDKSHTNAFQWLFLSDVPDSVVFDHIFHVECADHVRQELLKSDTTVLGAILTFGLDSNAYMVDLVHKLLRRGLGDRIRFLQYLRSPSRSWGVEVTAPLRTTSLTFGIVLNPESAFEVIIKGPQANEPEAIEFREFWGEKSQLRRFKDGSVTEACVFGSSQDCPSEKRMVTGRIVEHVLREHFLRGIPDSLWKLHYFANQLTCEFPVERSNSKYNMPDLETQSLSVMREFNEVEMELRRLEGLPLDITGILGVSPIFYYSDPKKNLPNGFFSRDDQIIFGDTVYDAVLTLAVSGKWPENVEAMRRLKAAFYLEIANRVRGVKGLFCSAAVDHVMILRGGYTFRFRLAHSKELQLLKQSMVDGVVAYRDTPQSLAMERNLFIKPSLASALHGLHQQHNAYGPTVCLVKGWLNSQLLDNDQWADECTELLVASLFLDDTRSVTTEPPVQPQAGFFRFLHMMANKNWQTEFVLLNFNETLSVERVASIQSAFMMNRSQYPPVTIITSFDDKFNGIWGREAPILQVLVRVIMLSKELLVRLTQKVMLREEFSNRSVWFTKFSGYDKIIHLDVGNVAFLRKNIMQSSTRLPADFDPIAIYLKELRSAFGDVALFFHNSVKPNRVGVLWKPSVDVPRDFRISDVNGRYLSSNQLVFDKEATCRDFLLIGQGIALKVE